VPSELLGEWFASRKATVVEDVRRIAEDRDLWGERVRLAPLIGGLEEMSRSQPDLPVRISVRPEEVVVECLGDRTREVVKLAAELVQIPSVTNSPEERLEEVKICSRVVAGHLRNADCELKLYDEGRYPAIVAGFPGALTAPITLCGHFDVVEPDPDDSQFEARVDGDYLWGRGAADMKTVVASMMVWMRERIAAGPPFPPFNLLLVGNEENGEGEPFGTPHVLSALARDCGWRPELMVVGERTGETGTELVGSVCTENRGVIRLRVVARGKKGHTGTGAIPGDLLDRLIEVRSVLATVFPRHLTLSSVEGWESTARFPFLIVGEDGVYNITAGEGVLGVEVRPIPQDDVSAMVDEVRNLAVALGNDVVVETKEAGICCPEDNRYLGRLVEAVTEVSGSPAVVGRKKPGSSARFAPGGNAVVWGQTGIGPHAPDERHFIPSIEPYLQVLDRFAALTLED